ncbi:MAG TPA: lysine biosynthesis protein LysW [Thermoanaerobaculaceae bacterium]|nr:lysine biosynthesis protein LysW [Thermoanaerobaculaceae bacterium]
MSPVHGACPVCDGAVDLAADVAQSEVVRCPDCGSDLEVSSLDPPVLVEAPAEEEDWGQ